jgi:hypothetical protein
MKEKSYLHAQLIKQYVMKTYGEWRYSSSILDLSTRWGDLSGSRPCRFTPEEERPPNPFDRRLGGPQQPVWTACRESNPGRLARSPSV